MGKKPVTTKPLLHPGQRACGHCGTPFRATGRNRYCTETCRYQAMMKRRRARRAA
jgi:predicted nucleic acid-binding Zn ribbon protein